MGWLQVKHLLSYGKGGKVGGTKTSLSQVKMKKRRTHTSERVRAPLVRCGCSAFPHSALRFGAKRMPTFIAPLQPTAAPQKAQQPFRAKDVAFSAPFDVQAHFFFFFFKFK